MSQRSQEPSTSSRRLNSWKEIASYLEVSVRTAQRWEAAEALPVRRHRHARLSSAYAYAQELDAWWDSRPGRRRKPSPTTPEPPRVAAVRSSPSIVVLPFVNLDRDEETEILGDGLTEDLTTLLSQIGQLRVVARSSALYFKGKAHDVREIGERLGVDNILEGSLRRAGRRVRVTAQLVSAADGCHIWAHRVDREIEDPFELQEQLAQAIAASLRVRLLHQPVVGSRPRDAETYNIYLRGRFFWSKRSPEGLQDALRCFKDVVRREPEFALGHSGMAETYLFLWTYAGAPWQEAMPNAQAAIDAALRIDPSNSEVHTSLGGIRIASYDLGRAEDAFCRALELSPGNNRARHWRAMALAGLGRFDEALGEISRAFELDPLGVTLNLDFGRILYLARRYEEAIQRLRHTLEIAPGSYWPAVYLALAYLYAGDHERALEAAAAEPLLSAFVQGRMGDQRALRKALSNNGEARRSFTWKAVAYMGLDQQQRAAESLQHASQSHEPEFLQLCFLGQPLFDGLGPYPNGNPPARE